MRRSRRAARAVVQLDWTGGEECAYAVGGVVQRPAPELPSRLATDRYGRRLRQEFATATGRQNPPRGEPAVTVWFVNDRDPVASLVVQQRGYYERNQRHSPDAATFGWQRFWPNGQPREGVHYRRGKKHGDTVQWDEQGREIRRETYKQGRLIPRTPVGLSAVEPVQADLFAGLDDPALAPVAPRPRRRSAPRVAERGRPGLRRAARLVQAAAGAAPSERVVPPRPVSLGLR